MSTGVTETITQFAGYLHLHSEVARLRLKYDEFLGQGRANDFDAARSPDNAPPKPFDEFLTSPRRFDPLSEPLPPIEQSTLPPFDTQPFRDHLDYRIKAGTERDLTNFPDGGGAPVLGGGLTVLNLVAVTPKITVTYEDGGDQLAVLVRQNNLLLDDDWHAPEGSAAGAQQMENIGETLIAYDAQADAELPPEFHLNVNDTGVVAAFLSDRDAAWKESGENVKGVIAPGAYIDGELQLADAVTPEFPREIGGEMTPQEEFAQPNEAPAQIATLGANLAVNSALIVDINHAKGTLVVVGDYFATDVIVQINLYADNDKIEYAGAGEAQIEGGGNEAFNIASFLETSAGVPSFAGSQIFAGTDWRVDVLDGDFYDIKAVAQSNRLHDNDVTVQDSTQTNYQLLAGVNEQGNFANFITLGSGYDLVIVLGDYHELNFIFQKNVLLDADTMMVLGYGELPDGEFADPAISSGGNWLQNEASIEHFGTSAWQTLTPAWEDLIARLQAGETELDLSMGIGIPNFGDETFDVLIITGSVFDVNIIDQENVIADADVGIQALPRVGSDNGPVIQSLSTGDNALGNFAAIVSAGPAADIYIGGELYEDEMLIQAEIVEGDDDAIVIGDPDALAEELVAFTSPPEETVATDEATHASNAAAGHHDLLGNALT